MKFSYDYKKLQTQVGVAMKKLPWALGRHAFLCMLMLAVMDVFIGEYLLYKYIISAKIEDSQSQTGAAFKEATYQSVIKEWQSRQDILNASFNQYENPFKL